MSKFFFIQSEFNNFDHETYITAILFIFSFTIIYVREKRRRSFLAFAQTGRFRINNKKKEKNLFIFHKLIFINNSVLFQMFTEKLVSV